LSKAKPIKGIAARSMMGFASHNPSYLLRIQSEAEEKTMKIGIIGSGRIGSVVGRLLADAGHDVMFSSRRPEALDALVAKVGGRATRGSVLEAARFGEVLLISVPLNALPALGQELASLIEGKVVLETGNPYPGRDGKVAEELIASGRGTGVFAREHLPGARVVRAFNSVWDQTLAKEATGLTRRLEFHLPRMIEGLLKSPRVWCETQVSIR
jgi:predicted dinucleotide-binding enzyme